MSWHIIVQIGQSDVFEPEVEDAEPRIHAVFERSDDRWYVRNDAISIITDALGKNVSAIAEDILYLALSVYTADLRIPRALAADRWERDFVVHFPSLNAAAVDEHREHIERTLRYLTGDRWKLRIRSRDVRTLFKEDIVESFNVEKVCLFSGGLDSLVGAIDLLSEGTHVAVVGHHGVGVTNSFQEEALGQVQREYADQITPFMFHAHPPKRNIRDGEQSMRSRSFLFFAMGVAVAQTVGERVPLVIAENGLISLNVPLTHSRSGSASTRTTHPHYVALFSEMLRRLGVSTPLVLPYRFKTKGQMLAECRDQDLVTTATKETMSCSHAEAGRFQGFSPKDHCGYCVPCIIRRAATCAAGTPDSNYNIDVRSDPPDHRTDGGRDLRAFQMAVERDGGLTAAQAVARILGQGPLPADVIDQYAEMYRHGIAEVRNFLQSRSRQ